jgi:hypothetical protein
VLETTVEVSAAYESMSESAFFIQVSLKSHTKGDPGRSGKEETRTIMNMGMCVCLKRVLQAETYQMCPEGMKTRKDLRIEGSKADRI